MRRWLVSVSGCWLLACGAGAPDEAALPVHTKVGLSPPLHIDRKFKSMEGPSAETRFRLGDASQRELYWVTAYRTEVVDADGQPRDGLAQFMCHNNLDFDSIAHRDLFGLDRIVAFGRLFTASQGVFEVEFPDGYGIPLFSDELLTVNTMVLNHNLENADLRVRHRITVEYVKDADARGRLAPLYPAFSPVMALLSGPDGYYGVRDAPMKHEEGASCAPGLVAPNAPEGTKYYRDPQQRLFTQHWIVPPGREVRHTLVTQVMNLPFDTTIHYLNAHLHPYAESLELRDLTTGKTLFRAYAHPPETGVGLAGVEHYTSTEGIPVFRDHAYEMVSVYQNDTGVDQDAMAVFFVYYRDVELERKLDALRARLAYAKAYAPPFSSPRFQAGRS